MNAVLSRHRRDRQLLPPDVPDPVEQFLLGPRNSRSTAPASNDGNRLVQSPPSMHPHSPPTEAAGQRHSHTRRGDSRSDHSLYVRRVGTYRLNSAEAGTGCVQLVEDAGPLAAIQARPAGLPRAELSPVSEVDGLWRCGARAGCPVGTTGSGTGRSSGPFEGQGAAAARTSRTSRRP